MIEIFVVLFVVAVFACFRLIGFIRNLVRRSANGGAIRRAAPWALFGMTQKEYADMIEEDRRGAAAERRKKRRIRSRILARSRPRSCAA